LSCSWCSMCGWFPVGYFYRRSKNILRMSYVRTYRFPSDCIVASTGPTRHQHSIKRTCRDPKLGQRFGSSSTGWYTWPDDLVSLDLARKWSPMMASRLRAVRALFPGLFPLARFDWWGWSEPGADPTWPLHTEKAMSRKKRTHSSGTGSTRYMPPLGTHPGLFSSLKAFYISLFMMPKSDRSLPIISSCFSFSCKYSWKSERRMWQPTTAGRYSIVTSRTASESRTRQYVTVECYLAWDDYSEAPSWASWLSSLQMAGARVTRHGAPSRRRGVGSYSA